LYTVFSGVETISIDIKNSIFKTFMMLSTLSMIMVPVAYATSVGAKDVVVNSEYVKATAMCSCGSNGYDHYITGTFVNYCPHCHSYETLEFNPKGTPEGEWTCSKCNSDYCAADGKEKIDGSKYCLTQYNVTSTDNTHNSTQNSTTKNQTFFQSEALLNTFQQTMLEQLALLNGKAFYEW
jgi:phage terminase large subunit GpA-like protein